MNLRNILLTLLLFITSNASAGLMQFNYSGVFDRISYSDCQSYKASGSCDSWTHSDPASSDFYQGSELGIGDTFVGSLIYETNSSYSLSSDSSQAVYLRAVTEHGFSIEDNTFPSMLLPRASTDGSVSIVNDRKGALWNYDSFYVSQSYSGTDWFMTTGIHLTDNSGSVYNSFDIPTTFDPNDFSHMSFNVSFLRRSDGDQLHLYGDITNISVQPVPLPGAVWLFVSAIIGVIGVSKRSLISSIKG